MNTQILRKFTIAKGYAFEVEIAFNSLNRCICIMAVASPDNSIIPHDMVHSGYQRWEDEGWIKRWFYDKEDLPEVSGMFEL